MLPLSLLLAQVAAAAAVPPSLYHNQPFKPPDEQQHVLLAPAPLSSPQGLISLGDSYSAGIGTRPNSPLLRGSDPTAAACRRGPGAYPYLLAQDSSVNSSFQWLSCTGSTTDDILSSPPSSPSFPSQIDRINTSLSPSFATLTISGNDLDFFSVLSACVFRFYGPWYGPSCSGALRRAEDMFSSPSNSSEENPGSSLELRVRLILTETLTKIRWDKNPKFFVTVAGYAAFFNDETEICDGVSLGVWLGRPGLGGVSRTGERLTREVRTRMNALVRKANELLERVAREVDGEFWAAGPAQYKGDGETGEAEERENRRRRKKVVFVNYDTAFAGHRLCEPGVYEPDYERKETWFFLPGGVDVDQAGQIYEHEGGGKEEDKVDEDDPLVDPEVCLGRSGRSGDWGERALCLMARAKKGDPTLRPAEKVMAQPGDSMWFTPTYYGKTFHPRSAGHEAIRDKIYEVWEEHGLLD